MNKQQLELLIKELNEIRCDISCGVLSSNSNEYTKRAYMKLSEVLITLENHYNEMEEV